MKVILTTRVAPLGHPWEVKEVKRGYAMNFLFPQKLAILATPQALKRAEKLQSQQVKKVEEMKAGAQEMLQKMKDLVLHFKQKAKGEKLYGSITEKDVVEAMLAQHKLELDKSMVKMKEHIKTLGEHTVAVHLTEGVAVNVKVVVEGE